MGDVATLRTLRLSPLRPALSRPCGGAAALHPDPAAGLLRHGRGWEARPPQHRRPPGPNSSRSRVPEPSGERGVQDQAIPATGRAGSQRAERGNVPHYDWACGPQPVLLCAQRPTQSKGSPRPHRVASRCPDAVERRPELAADDALSVPSRSERTTFRIV